MARKNVSQKILPSCHPEILIFRVLLKPALRRHLNDSPKGFFKNIDGHFALSACAVIKNDRHFFNAKTVFPSQKFHFDLKGIAQEFYLAQRQGVQHISSIADEAGRGVEYRDAGDEAHVEAGEVGKQYASYWPIHHVHARDVARPYRQIKFIFRASAIETN